VALNKVQKDFLDSQRTRLIQLKDLYGHLYNLKESFDEDFSTGQTNFLRGDDLGDGKYENDAELLEDYGVLYGDVQAVHGQSVDTFLKYFTNQSISGGDYGKYIRKISGP